MKKQYSVHRYEVVRVKISPVAANSAIDAIKATDAIDMSSALAINKKFVQNGFTIEEVAFSEGAMTSAMVDTLLETRNKDGAFDINYDEERNFGIDHQGEVYEINGASGMAGEDALSLIRQIAETPTSTEPASALLSAEDNVALLDRMILFARRHQAQHTAPPEVVAEQETLCP